MSLNYDKLQKEANFRFSLFRARENAESIAFYDRLEISIHHVFPPSSSSYLAMCVSLLISDAALEEEGTWAVFQQVPICCLVTDGQSD